MAHTGRLAALSIHLAHNNRIRIAVQCMEFLVVVYEIPFPLAQAFTSPFLLPMKQVRLLHAMRLTLR